MLLILSAWWFWITIVALVALVVCEATESPFWAGCFLFLAAVLYHVAGVDWIGYVKDHPINTLLFVLGYFVAGTIWCVAKWLFFLLNIREELKEHKSFPFDSRVTGKLMRTTDFPPRAKDYKNKIVRWIMYWPFSMIWSLIDDVVRRISKMIYNLISSFLQSISDRVFKNEISRREELLKAEEEAIKARKSSRII